MYKINPEIKNITHLQITYCNIDTEDIVQFQKAYSFDELEKWFQNLCWEYHKWAKFQCEWHMLRQASIKLLEFAGFPETIIKAAQQ